VKMAKGNQVRNRVTEVVLRLLRLVLVSVAVMLAPAAWAGVDQATLEQAEALLKDGKAEAAYQMLEPLEGVGAGDLVFDYLLATAALESGKPSKATLLSLRLMLVCVLTWAVPITRWVITGAPRSNLRRC
jgi:hypothetical protein